MAGNSINSALINLQVAADANQIGQSLAWLEKRIYQWTTNCGTAADMAALGYSATTDQAEVIQHIANLNAINSCISGKSKCWSGPPGSSLSSISRPSSSSLATEVNGTTSLPGLPLWWSG